jgi:hypothetical protein
MYLDAVIGGQELWGGVVPKIGRKFIQVVAIEGFPWSQRLACCRPWPSCPANTAGRAASSSWISTSP